MPPPEALDLLAQEDPVAAFDRARREGRPIALSTSGSTGHTRTIVRTTDSWTASFPHVSRLTGIDATSRVHVPGPTSATMNLFALVHAAAFGATPVDDLRRATHAHLTPTALRRQLASEPEALAGTHVVVAGDRLDVATHDAARAADARVSHYYGAAELSFVAWGRHEGDLRPFPGVEVAARDGRLWVRSPYVCSGPGLPTDGHGWVTVGDRGDLTDGVLTVHGREGSITTGGATVTVADVEGALRPHARGQLVVVGIPHPDLGEVVAAAVTDDRDVARLARVSREVLAHVERPRRWLHLDPLPVGESGKIDRAAVCAALSDASGARR